MTSLLAAATIKGPHIDWAALSPLVALTAGVCVVLLAGLARTPFVRAHVVPALTIVALGLTAGLTIWQWDANTQIVSHALAIDTLAMALTMVFVTGAIAAVLLSWRSSAVRQAGEGEYFALLLSSVLGMVVLVAANDLIVLFLGFELLSIPLYVLCATHMRREHSLESGLKYLIIGSVGSATLLYGLALIYGATGVTGFDAIARAAGGVSGDVLFLTGVALVVVGLAFKASVAPFHQWTPDVYEGAPTPVTGFMAVATKAAAFGIVLRFFDVALIDAASTWAPAFATLAVITIVVGNVGAIGQSSLKRLLAYSSVAQAGYMLAGVVVSTRLGVEATVFYLAIYVVMNMAAFAVIAVRERETDFGDDISSMYGLGASRPELAWPMTIAMLALAGFPATAGFFGKLYLISAAVDNGYAWLGIVIVVGSAVSLAYYLRVIAAVWMRPASDALTARRRGGGPGGTVRPAMAGGSREADDEARAAGREPGAVAARGADGVTVSSVEVDEPAGGGRRLVQAEVVFVAVVCAVATIAIGIYPEPLFNVARDAGNALQSLL
jgi:NADH-quinone oxidoreductase subunit N